MSITGTGSRKPEPSNRKLKSNSGSAKWQCLSEKFRYCARISGTIAGNSELRCFTGTPESRTHLAATDDAQNRLQQTTAQKQQLERSLEIGDYAIDKQEELRQLDHTWNNSTITSKTTL